MKTRSRRQSSLVRVISYEPRARALTVHLTNGGVYRYREVPVHVFEGFIVAESKGAYFNKTIRGKYPWEMVKAPSGKERADG